MALDLKAGSVLTYLTVSLSGSQLYFDLVGQYVFLKRITSYLQKQLVNWNRVAVYFDTLFKEW